MGTRRRTTHQVLTDALDAANYSASKLAADAGLDWSTVAKWKSGVRNPQPDNLRAVARALAARGGRMVEVADDLAATIEGDGHRAP